MPDSQECVQRCGAIKRYPELTETTSPRAEKAQCAACLASQCFRCGSPWDERHRLQKYLGQAIQCHPVSHSPSGESHSVASPASTACRDQGQSNNNSQSPSGGKRSTERARNNSNSNEEEAGGDEGEREERLETQTRGRKAATFEGIVTLVDENGWTQRLSLVYDLLISCTKGSNGGRCHTTMTLEKLRLRVPKSEFQQEHKHDQFRIKSTAILLEPTVDGLVLGAYANEYREGWSFAEEHPTMSFYKNLPSSTSREGTISAALTLSAPPSMSLSAGHKSSKVIQNPPIASTISLEKSKFIETCYRGFECYYEMLADACISREGLDLGPHLGVCKTPNPQPPWSIQAKVTVIYKIIKPRGKIQSILTTERRMRFLGYRHVKVCLKTDVHWHPLTLAEFPLQSPSECLLKIRHQLRGGIENTVAPQQARFDGLSTELSAVLVSKERS